MNRETQKAKAMDLASTVEFYQDKQEDLQTVEGIKRFLQTETSDIRVLILSEKFIKEAGKWPEGGK